MPEVGYGWRYRRLGEGGSEGAERARRREPAARPNGRARNSLADDAATVELVEARDGGRRLAAFAVLRADARFVPGPRELRAYL